MSEILHSKCEQYGIPYCGTEHFMSMYWNACLMTVTVTETCSSNFTLLNLLLCCDWPIFWLATDFSLLQNVHTGSGAHAASYSMGTEGKAKCWGVKLTSHLHLMVGEEWEELYLHCPWMPSRIRQGVLYTYLTLTACFDTKKISRCVPIVYLVFCTGLRTNSDYCT
jgi:hypothetical protein